MISKKVFYIILLLIITVTLPHCLEKEDDDSSTSSGTTGTQTNESFTDDVSPYGGGSVSLNPTGSLFGTVQAAYYDTFADNSFAYIYLLDQLIICDDFNANPNKNIVFMNIPMTSGEIKTGEYTGSANDTYIFVQNAEQNSDGDYEFTIVRTKVNVILNVSEVNADATTTAGDSAKTVTVYFDGRFEDDAEVYTVDDDGTWQTSSATNPITGPIKGATQAVYCNTQ